MPERLKGTVLKTVVAQKVTVGSNPTPSASLLPSVPSNATVESATLTLCMQNILSLAVGHTHGLHKISNPWTEASVNWNTMPSFSGGVEATISVPLLVGCVNFDVTNDVEQWVAGSGGSNEGWMVMDESEGAGGLTGVEYASSEHGNAGQRPRLTIVYTP